MYAHSLSTGIVVELAARIHWTQPIVLAAPYTSIKDAGAAIVGSWVYLIPYDELITIDNIKRLSCCVTIYHGYQDTVIPYTHSLQLQQASSNVSLNLSNTGHNDILELI